MEILKDIFENMIRINHLLSYEQGGILGGRSGIVTRIAFDIGYENSSEPCCYTPNVTYLNKIIEDWISEGDMFMGLFHTHMGDSKKLSDGDKNYISDIVCSMPTQISYLYFPIISLPSRTVTCFRAELDQDRVMISDSKVVIRR